MAKTVTLSSMRSQTRQRADMVNSTFCTDSEINQYLNNSLAELYDILIEKFENDYFLSSSSITIVADTNNYSLPADFYKVVGVDIVISANQTITLTRYNFSDRNLNNRNLYVYNRDAYTLRYRIQGSKIYFSPTPSSAYTGTLWYIPAFTDISTDAGTFDGVSGWEEYAIVDAAIKCLQKEESDVSALMSQKDKLLRRIESAAENRDAGNPATITDISRYAKHLFY